MQPSNRGVTEAEIDGVQTDTNGTIIIDEVSNGALHSKIADALDSSTQATFPGAVMYNLSSLRAQQWTTEQAKACFAAAVPRAFRATCLFRCSIAVWPQHRQRTRT